MAIEYRPGTSRVVRVPGYGPDILQNEQVTPGAWVETDDEGNVLRSGYEVYKEARSFAIKRSQVCGLVVGRDR